MKHIKHFEDSNDESGVYDKYLETNDIVILIAETSDSINFEYKIGDMCRIRTVDKDDSNFPYEIINITNDYCADLWVEYDQIRLAEKWEIDQNKYNL